MDSTAILEAYHYHETRDTAKPKGVELSSYRKARNAKPYALPGKVPSNYSLTLSSSKAKGCEKCVTCGGMWVDIANSKAPEPSNNITAGSRELRSRPSQVTFGHSLTLPVSAAAGCQNSRDRKGLWLKPRKFYSQERGFFSLLGQLCIESGIRDCQNKACKLARERMDNCAPKCEWKIFRHWVLVAMSCQAAMSKEEKQSVAHTHLANVASSCCLLLKSCVDKETGGHYFMPFLDMQSSTEASISFAGVTNLIYWAARIQAEASIGLRQFDRWDRRLLPTHVVLPPIELAMRRIEEMGLCKNRIWNLIDVSDRKEADLPDIIDALEQVMKCQQDDQDILFHHADHEKCIPSKCQWSQMDSTKVEQLHKCQERNCGFEQFSTNLLQASLMHGESTAWSCSGNRISDPNDRYIAISHVWSDGTGVGLQGPGVVNKCLFTYFANIAEELDCKAIWWDAISIPPEPKARSKALGRMHENYQHAFCTVIHDRYLLNFPWDNEGGPCLALVLSTWFTRGWTALELLMSHTVKVLFKDPNPNNHKPLIKDLDKDILAISPAASSRGHWIATMIVKRLRHHPINVAGDLLAVLRGRSTSWTRDRTIIAALLAKLPKCDFAGAESEITCTILSHIGHMSIAALLHGHPTIRDMGSFSWCAATLDDMPVDVLTNMGGGVNAKTAAQVEITAGGGINGCWWARPLRHNEMTDSRIRPLRDEGAASVKITSALRCWRSCLLLRDVKDRSADDPVLLVTVLGIRHADATLLCRYAGAVLISRKDNEKKMDVNENSWHHIWAEIGGNSDNKAKHPMDASYALVALDKFDDEKIATQMADPEAISLDDEPFDLIPGPDYLSWYEHQQKDATEEDGVAYILEPVNSEHLLTAVQSRNKDAIRYLIKLKVELAGETKAKLINGENNEAKYVGIQMLGDVYIEDGRLQDAAEMYEIAVRGLADMPQIGRHMILKAQHALGNAYMRMKEEKQQNDAEQLFAEILKECDIKKVRNRLKNEIESQAKDTVGADQEQSNDKEIYTCKNHNKTLKEWNRLEFDTAGDLTLLYVNQGDMKKAAKTYSQILGKFGMPPSEVEAFISNLSTRVAQPSTDSTKQYEDSRVLYYRVIKEFEIVYGKGFKEHALTLITTLNLGINQILQGKGHEKETEELLNLSNNGLKKLFGPDHKTALTDVCNRAIELWQIEKETPQNLSGGFSGEAENGKQKTMAGSREEAWEAFQEKNNEMQEMERRWQAEVSKRQMLERKLQDEVSKREKLEAMRQVETSKRERLEKELQGKLKTELQEKNILRKRVDELQKKLSEEMKREQDTKRKWQEELNHRKTLEEKIKTQDFVNMMTRGSYGN